MAKVYIEKYVDGAKEQTFALPVFVLRILFWLAPREMRTVLSDKGFDIHSVLEAARNDAFYRREFEIREKGIVKRVLVYLG